ncbi:carotenoid biosynthesis protein [Neolewinella lacunae]|uniref:carotenoid biosynthesis protein n=1 Tax=Neolewinella lacunae TaxID=1517758 RepID=UPI001FE57C8F|nr:carotenoid biosynthesis protein [Neolewinella lacunae]MDN3635252.1 carotenoid biosynthesis protein [Neolewinella lacunae]
MPITRVTTDGLLLVINGLLIYAVYRRNRGSGLFLWLLVAYWFTFAMEAIGVATGAVFGNYTYGPTMWWQWLGVPFVIALNWCVLTLACNELALRMLPPPAKGEGTLGRKVAVAALAGGITAFYDVVIEPVAIQLDYWQWGGGEIPLQNYLAWALIAFVISLPLHLFGVRFRSPVLLVYFFAQLFFFGVLNLAL